ncbi:MAG: PorV/PorQ family protein, partial [bacterium]|nr:PorV/PorQ family protein [bacterium]
MEEKPGITSATFLKIGVGARATGMGEAACAVADDANAIYWNPAGLGFFEEKQVSAMYNILFEDIKHGFVGYTHPFKSCTLGGAINYLDTGEMEKTTRADDLAGYITYARRLGGKLSLGVNLKYIQQRIEEEKATCYGADLGILYKPFKLRLGLAVQNIGTKLKFIEEGYSLPLNIKAGAAYPFRNFL